MNDDKNGTYDKILAQIGSPADCKLIAIKKPTIPTVVKGETALFAFSLLAVKAPQNAAKMMNNTKASTVNSRPQDKRLPTTWSIIGLNLLKLSLTPPIYGAA